MKKFLLLVIFLFLVNLSVFSQNIVSYVIDGDTYVMDDKTRVRIRNIDAPEMDQPFRKEAKSFAMKMLLNKEVILLDKEPDRYGRTLARVEINGDDFATLLVLKGLAWNSSYFSNSLVLKEAETLAKKSRVGLWSNQNPVPPWRWRKNPSGK